ncbi:ABC transporter permease [Sphaerisporangium siamense]|uniref:ABC-type dipeptide/oligopeptide/nickel transport system permease subunit n=1 Tax=Sphaerisporangium siamense TaxID=795645 RepID=A0A7W7DCU7_9ACTN|nr:ABC transporter permease [Sphaerisporangium siamense]MBB4704490.1 ABC-type dipeptide/oligopeptide/nickel transport system permease subunit [Sphaerisporangium siamense]
MSALTWTGVVLLLLFVLLAVLGPLLAGAPDARTGRTLAAPSAEHLFGTDHLQRDLFARTAEGARVSLLVAVAAVAFGLLVAVPAGLVAGYFGGRRIDDLIMRVLEALQALPLFVFALFVIGVTGTGDSHIGPVPFSATAKVVILLGVGFIPYFARVARSAALVEVQEDYVDALRVIGVPRRRIIAGEVLVNVLPPVLVQAFLWLGVAIFAESALSFLGLGIQPPRPSLGNILGDATGYMLLGAWWYSIIPGLVILVATVGFNLAGDGLGDALDAQGHR